MGRHHWSQGNRPSTEHIWCRQVQQRQLQHILAQQASCLQQQTQASGHHRGSCNFSCKLAAVGLGRLCRKQAAQGMEQCLEHAGEASCTAQQHPQAYTSHSSLACTCMKCPFVNGRPACLCTNTITLNIGQKLVLCTSGSKRYNSEDAVAYSTGGSSVEMPIASSSSGWVIVPRSIMVVAIAEAHFSSAARPAL